MLRLDQVHRDVLYSCAYVDLRGAAADVGVALRNGDLDELMEARERFEVATQLLDDLGWRASESRLTYELSVDPERLADWLERHVEFAGVAGLFAAEGGRVRTDGLSGLSPADRGRASGEGRDRMVDATCRSLLDRLAA